MAHPALSDTADRRKITQLLILGSLGVAIILSGLLLVYDLSRPDGLRVRLFVGFAVILYLVVARSFLAKGYIKTAGWMLILLYELLAFIVMLTWGLASAVGILTACLATVLPGIMLSPKATAPVSAIALLSLITVYLAHSLGFVTPTTYIPPEKPSFLDVIAYATMLGIFALLSWISAKQATTSLSKSLKAKRSLEIKKSQLATELEEESAELRRTQMAQIEELYKFAIIGQSTAATLHELSNHLSVLNLDLDDLKQRHRNSKSIKKAEEDIRHINQMVRRARAQLNSTSEHETIPIAQVIDVVLGDVKPKLAASNTNIDVSFTKNALEASVFGGDHCLAQCLTILITNAFEAIKGCENPKITIRVKKAKEAIHIDVIDNGPGVPRDSRKKLFMPHESEKSTGLGVGLYIAHHITKNHLRGTLGLVETSQGAHFKLTLPAA